MSKAILFAYCTENGVAKNVADDTPAAVAGTAAGTVVAVAVAFPAAVAVKAVAARHIGSQGGRRLQARGQGKPSDPHTNRKAQSTE